MPVEFKFELDISGDIADTMLKGITEQIQENFEKTIFEFADEAEKRMPELTGALKEDSKKHFDVSIKGPFITAETASALDYSERRYTENYRNPDKKYWYHNTFQADVAGWLDKFGGV